MANSFPTERVAKTICEFGDWNVSNLELQKILYVANLMWVGEKKKALVDDAFKAWEYGPVIPSLYHKLKDRGYSAITEDAFDNFDILGKTKSEAEARKLIQDVCEEMLDEPVYDMVALTHIDGGAWSKTPKNGFIDNNDIINEYNTYYT